MNEGKSPFIHNLTKASQEVLDGRIQKALDSSGFALDLTHLKEEKEAVESQLSENTANEQDLKALKDRLQRINDKIDVKQTEIDALKETQRKEQVKDAETESGGDTTKKVSDSGRGWKCVIIWRMTGITLPGPPRDFFLIFNLDIACLIWLLPFISVYPW